jgi:formylglycine-generating enzyme required for sulfatase activity
MVAVMLPLALLAWSEPIRELRDCATCPALIEMPAGAFERLDLLSTMPVGSYEPNAFGLYEMMGNVAQWVADCANTSCAEAPQDGLAWLAGDCTQRLARGGTWHSNWSEFASYRKAITADGRRNDTGFRVAKSLR